MKITPIGFLAAVACGSLLLSPTANALPTIVTDDAPNSPVAGHPPIAHNITHRSNSSLPHRPTAQTSNMSLILYTASCTQDESWDAGAVDGFPWLFIGSLSAAESHEHLRANGVTRVLTVAKNLPVATLPEGIDHLRVDVDDHPNANFLAVVAQCREFIDAAAAERAKNDDDQCGSILVHCASGVSRSATAIIGWLMDPERGYSLDEALAALRVNRPLAHPNVGFVWQMQVLEKHGGNVDKALPEWEANTKTDFLERVALRRQAANDIHAAADELEVKIQKLISSQTGGGDVDDSQESTAWTGLLRETNLLSDRLDNTKGDLEGLPEDRVARSIFKSARDKIERLFSYIHANNQKT